MCVSNIGGRTVDISCAQSKSGTKNQCIWRLTVGDHHLVEDGENLPVIFRIIFQQTGQNFVSNQLLRETQDRGPVRGDGGGEIFLLFVAMTDKQLQFAIARPHFFQQFEMGKCVLIPTKCHLNSDKLAPRVMPIRVESADSFQENHQTLVLGSCARLARHRRGKLGEGIDILCFVSDVLSEIPEIQFLSALLSSATCLIAQCCSQRTQLALVQSVNAESQQSGHNQRQCQTQVVDMDGSATWCGLECCLRRFRV